MITDWKETAFACCMMLVFAILGAAHACSGNTAERHPDLRVDDPAEILKRTRERNEALERCRERGGVPVRGYERPVECLLCTGEHKHCFLM